MDIKNISKEQLEKLSPEERKIALDILKQYANKGSSDIFNNLIYDDYEEIPVDIDTFIDNENYLRYAWYDNEGNCKLFPYWRDKLHEIFPNNLDVKFNDLIFSGARGLGKMNPLDTPVLTKNGFIPMGEVKIGTMVYGRDGNLHKVLQVFPHDYQDIYEIYFSDGTKSECGLEHLWLVKDHHVTKKHKSYPPETKIVNTKDLLRLNFKYAKNRYEIPMCNPIKFEKVLLPLDPYILGLLIGDGCFNKVGISLTTADAEIANYFDSYIKQDSQGSYHAVNYKSKNSAASSYRISKINNKSKEKNKYSAIIESLGLMNHKSLDKFIPTQYLYNSIEDRIALLQGLLDTDGTANKSKRRCDGKFSYNINYSTVSERLKDDVVWLVQSLGGTAKVIKRKSKYINPKGELRVCNSHYRISIKLPSNIAPFRLKRKLDLYNSCNHKEPSRYIVGIKKLKEKKKAQCIYIDGDEHLYLVNDFIVTHNTEVAVLIGAYLMYKIMCLKNPLQHYHMKPTEKFCFAFMNIKKDAAEEIANSKFQNTIKSSPWFLKHGKLTGRNMHYWEPPDYIDIIVGSQSSDVIGLPIFYAFFDEISFMRNKDIDEQKKKAIDMIDTAIGGMMTRFIYNGKNPTLLVLASSKRSDKSFLEEHVRKTLEDKDANALIVDEPVWNVHPKGRYKEETFPVAVGNKFLISQVLTNKDDLSEYIRKGYTIIHPPIDFRSRFNQDIDRALCDYAGISSTELSKYISGSAVNDCINKNRKNPFIKEIIEVGNGKDDKAEYKDFFDLSIIDKNMLNKPLYIHLDMSISGDMTGIAGIWIKGKKPSKEKDKQEKDLFFELAFCVSVKAPKGRQISFEKNRNFIRWLKEVGFNIREISTDTFQSYDLRQQLESEGFTCSIQSVDKVDSNSHICIPYQFLKNVIYEQRIDIFEDNSLIEELVNLERNINNGKVDHPSGGRKDSADALCGATFTASKYAEEYAYSYGEDYDAFLDANETAAQKDENFKRQLMIDFEEELKNMNPIQQSNNTNTNKQNEEQQPFIMDGVVIW